MKHLNKPLTLGFSPCPNDTFIFHGLVHGAVDLAGLRLAPAQLADVETLNKWAMQGKLDITKLSFHALGQVLKEYALLSAGGALGRGCGPLLVAGRSSAGKDLAALRVAIPGRYTTAAMLLRLFAPECERLTSLRFDRIMPAIEAGEVEAGVIIHESRFTYQDHGLALIQDLGVWWEEVTGMPIPLGGIAARRSLGPAVLQMLDRSLRASVQWGRAHPEQCLPYIRQHARELDDRVVQEHIGLYVNRFSEELGAEGMAAVREFLRRGREAGIMPPGGELLEITSGTPFP